MIDNVFIFNRELDVNEIQQRTNCPLIGDESGLVGYWNFELPSQAYSNALGGVNVSLDASGPNCQQQIGGFMCSGNGNNGVINGATYTTNVPSQSCNLTNISGCDSVAVLNLTINQSDTSYTNITSCDSLVWNGITYDSSGTYYSNTGSNNNYSMNFDGVNDYIEITDDNIFDHGQNNFTINSWVKFNSLANDVAIFDHLDNSQSNARLCFRKNISNQLHLSLKDDNGNYFTSSSVTTITDFDWHFYQLCLIITI